MATSYGSIPKPWLYGFLDLCLLGLLRSGRDYGYGLSARLAAAGLGEVPGGTLYPALLRLETAGYVSVARVASPSGPPRKYYELTPAGEQAAAEKRAAWLTFAAASTP